MSDFFNFDIAKGFDKILKNTIVVFNVEFLATKETEQLLDHSGFPSRKMSFNIFYSFIFLSVCCLFIDSWEFFILYIYIYNIYIDNLLLVI